MPEWACALRHQSNMKFCGLSSRTEKSCWRTPTNQRKSVGHDTHWVSFLIHFNSLSLSLLKEKTVLEHNTGKYVRGFYQGEITKQKSWHSATSSVCVCVCVCVCIHVRYQEACVCLCGRLHSLNSFSRCVRRSVNDTGQSCCPITKNIWVIVNEVEVLHRHMKIVHSMNLFLISLSCLFSRFSDLLDIS